MAEEAKPEDQAGKKGGLVPIIAGLGILTVVGAAGGWVLGGMIAPKEPVSAASPKPQEASTAAGQGEEGKKEEGLPRISTAANGVILLEPITTNLAYPSENWVRLEVALAFRGAPELPLAEAIHQDIMAYMRTVSLQQIEGPRGFQYLKEDLKERIDLRSQGKVAQLMFRSFVIE